jgi:methionyl-tRNA synthetase
MANKTGFYITTPIYYPNAKLHMGHAYTTTVCDIVARYHRLMGEQTYFLSGADENTEKVVQAAEKEGKDVHAFLDGVVANFHDLYEKLEISNDQFIRTSDEARHWPGAQALWRKLVEAGDIYKAPYKGLYCVGAESFVTEKDLREGGLCPDHDEKPLEVQEENYFFRLSAYSARIREAIESGELEIVPAVRKNEILALIDRGLEDVSFSRPAEKVTLGIPVPDDPTQKMYVWCDALTNYLSALGYGTEDDSRFQAFWPADYHVVGKDILRFHAAIWPAMLLSAGLPLPKRVLVHGMITSGGRKMSKSLGNVIDPLELIEQYGAEAVRYYLAREISPFEDGDLTRESFHEAYTANLVNGLGNQVARIMKLAEMHLAAPVELLAEDKEFDEHVSRRILSFELNQAMDLIFTAIARADLFIQETQPFKKIKSDVEDERDEARRGIEKLVRHLYKIAVTLEPFLPETSENIKKAVLANRMPEALFPRKELA